eukprot:g16678.t2
MDDNESAQEAASRELYEETGIQADIKWASPPVVLDPGMGDSNTVYVAAEINNHGTTKCVAHNDDGEFITVHRVAVEGLLASLHDFSRSGYQVDARLYAYAMGLDQNAGRRAEGRGSRNLEGRGGGFLGAIAVSCAVSFLVGLYCRKIWR